MKAEQLRRMALRTGAQLEMGGKTINAGRQRLAVVPKRPAPEPAPTAPAAPPAPDPLRDLIAMQAETLGRVLTDITARLEPKVVNVPAKRMQPVTILVARNDKDVVVGLEPIYGEVADDATLSDLVPSFDERGLMTKITPQYG